MLLFSGNKKFAVVEFLGAGTIEVIPSLWIDTNNQGRWPSKKSKNQIIKCIRDCVEPEDDWETLSLKIYGFSNTFKGGHLKAQEALYTSHLDSESSEEERGGISGRKKKRPARYCESSDEDCVSNNAKKMSFSRGLIVEQNKLHTGITSSDEEIPPSQSQKKFYPPVFPAFKESLISPKPSSSKKAFSIGSKENIGNFSQNSLSESLISPNQRSLHNETPVVKKIQEDSGSFKMRTIMLKVFETLTEIKNEIKELKKQQGCTCSSSCKVVSNESILQMPEDISLPLSSDVELIDLEKRLQENANLQAVFIRYFDCVCSGKSLSAFLLSVSRRLLSKDVALQYSRLGRKGKKSFESLSAVANTILATASRRFPDVKRQELAEKFGKVLATAADWDGRRTKVQPTNLEIETEDCWGLIERI